MIDKALNECLGRSFQRADMIILDQSPLAVPPEKIKEIRVLATVKDGVFVWKRK